MSGTKKFHIGDVISAATGRLVSTRHIGGVYDILGFMSGESLMTHQLPRVAREAEPSLRSQHPELCAVEVPAGLDSEGKVLAWLATLYPRFGVEVEVAPMGTADHTHINPIAEIKMINPKSQVFEAPHE